MRASRKSCAVWLAFGVAAYLAAPRARSDEYACRLPRALLCEGCASHIAITLQRGGGCRVSFTPESAAPSANDVAKASEPFEIRVETAPTAWPRVARRPARRLASARSESRHPCFVFNAREYCE
jgi:hypothetical protein